MCRTILVLLGLLPALQPETLAPDDLFAFPS